MNYELILVPPSRLILFLTLQVVNQTLSQLQHHLLWHQQSLVVTMRIDRSQEMGHLALVNLLHVQVVGIHARTTIGDISQAVAQFHTSEPVPPSSGGEPPSAHRYKSVVHPRCYRENSPQRTKESSPPPLPTPDGQSL